MELDLYNLTVEEWYNKQKVIDNLCHFTRTPIVTQVTMMNTVQLLWEKRFEEEDKLNNAETAIEILQRNNGDLNVRHVSIQEENENIKTKITEAEVEIMTAIGDKDRMEEFYRSSSCIGFYSENRIAKEQSPEKCSACSDVESQLEKHKS